MAATSENQTRPREAIRRFDVFAEVNRLKALAEGRPEDEAKGYGIWLAKVVAGRRFGGKKARTDHEPRGRDREDQSKDRSSAKFRHAGDVLQTGETFDHEIIERMGRAFYDDVFSPAIRRAVDAGKGYEQIRDTIRSSWKPAT